MNDLKVHEENKLIRLETIEHRIKVELNSVYGGIVEVGHCLIEAKALVEHGSWGDWLQRVSGLTERQAQRWMQIAKEIPADSAAARLPVSHIQELLAAPADKREDLAAKAADESLTVKQLREEIAKEKRLFSKMSDMNSEKAEQISRLESRLDGKALQISELANKNRDLEKALKEAESRPATGISLEAQAQIDSLKADLKDAQDFASAQAEKRAAAQQELLDYKRNAQEVSGSEFGFDSEALRLAAATFMAQAGILPHMGSRLALIGQAERDAYAASVDMIAAWVNGAYEALNTVRGEVIA